MLQAPLSEVELEAGVAEMLNKTPSTTDTTMTDKEVPNISPYGSFSKLPSELRILVWNGVLQSKKDVFNAFRFMGPQQPLMVATCPPNNDIDAAILRTSRAIYEETFPILYGKNRFAFHSPSQIPTFAFGELCKLFGRSPLSDSFRVSLERYLKILVTSRFCLPTSISALEEAVLITASAQGRLSMLRSVTLSLTKPDTPSSFNSTRMSYNILGQEAIWSFWGEFFEPSSEQLSLTFPVLEDLCLRFSQWGLDASDASKLRIEPFLRRLRPSGGLQRLCIFDVKHEQNLYDFKYGFLKEGGRFKALENKNTILAEGIVSYNNLHNVSKGVRDILQRDGVPAWYG
ncbi:MAG: hypothetical protein ASARMPREDX12_002614 [Alectoria sarmentosa]|nr:MAG: hypothetical protein ASARMPREDX12_002614 [Alectoria sarmentosa]